jgi:hypothetical protein
MAKFLETQAISSELMKLIKEAKDKIILVSPYLKVNSQIQERLRTKSKTGALSEIVIVYGKSELQKSELEWIKDIEDLKVIEKNNLHAKCYINEDKAIICSMNLYEYSQQTNIEMGILITKEHDKEAYENLLEEITNIKVNGIRKKFDNLNIIEIQEKQNNSTDDNTLKFDKKEEIKKEIELTYEQKLKSQILKKWRFYKSKNEKISAFLILTDEEIKSIISRPKIDSNKIFEIIPKKNAIKYCEEILSQLNNIDMYVIGKVINVWYQDNSTSYDRVKLKIFKTNEERWFDTTFELPIRDKVLGVKINNTWFNEYMYLDY